METASANLNVIWDEKLFPSNKGAAQDQASGEGKILEWRLGSWALTFYANLIMSWVVQTLFG